MDCGDWENDEDWEENEDDEWDDVTPMASVGTTAPQTGLEQPIATPSSLPVPENVTITLGSDALGDSAEKTASKKRRRVLFRTKQEVS